MEFVLFFLVFTPVHMVLRNMHEMSLYKSFTTIFKQKYFNEIFTDV